jgi:hypothetical protein
VLRKYPDEGEVEASSRLPEVAFHLSAADTGEPGGTSHQVISRAILVRAARHI